MNRRNVMTARMRTALACLLALIIAVSMGHSHNGFAFSGDHHGISASDTHGHPADHDHLLSADCTTCPSSACSFLVTTSAQQVHGTAGAVVFNVGHQRLHSALPDGPLRPPNPIA